MRLMALQAIFSGGFVYPFRIHLLTHFIVATQTQVGTRSQEQRIQWRLVRVVAARAVAGDDRLMSARLRWQFVSDIVVAFRAYRGLLTGQDTLERARMRSMASQAFTIRERIVDASAGLFPHQFLVAFDAEACVDGL